MLSAHWTQFPQHHNPYQQHHHFPKQVEMMDAMGIDPHAQPHTRRKRKADAQPENNERLSKRLSLLNLGTFLFIYFILLLAFGACRLVLGLFHPQAYHRRRPSLTLPLLSPLLPSSTRARRTPFSDLLSRHSSLTLHLSQSTAVPSCTSRSRMRMRNQQLHLPARKTPWSRMT